MNFSSWFGRKENRTSFDSPENLYDPIKKDYSSVGIDSTYNRTDMLAATGMSFPTVVGSNSVAGMTGFYGGYFNFSGWQGSFPFYAMHALSRLYLWMAQDPDIRYGVDEIVNEAVITSYKNNVIDLNLDDLEIPEKFKAKILNEWDTVIKLMNFNNTAHFHIEDFYVNGRAFYKVDINKDKINQGIKKIKQISCFDMIAYFDAYNNVFKDPEGMNLNFKEGYVMTENAFRNAYYLGLTNPNMIMTRNQNYYVAVPAELIVYQHSGLIDWRSNVPISYLHLVMKTLNQLRNLRDAMIIYRMTRAPERFVFNVEVGKMQAQKAENYVAEVANRLKQTMVYNPETGQFKDSEEKLQIYKDWYFPKVDGKGTEVDVLQAGNMIGQLEEVESIQKTLFRQMFIPPNRYFDDNARINFGNEGEIEKMEVKFYKFVKKIQIQYGTIMFNLLKKQLAYKNIVTEKEFTKHLMPSMKLDWGTDNAFNEAQTTSMLKRKANTLSAFDNYVGKYGISQSWVTKKVMGFTDEEIKENEENLVKELKRQNYLDQIKNGLLKFDENGAEVKQDFGMGGSGIPGSDSIDNVGGTEGNLEDENSENQESTGTTDNKDIVDDIKSTLGGNI